MVVGHICRPLYRLAQGRLTRRRARHPEVAVQPGQRNAGAEGQEPAAAGAVQALDSRAILEALEGVEPACREALQLFYFDRLSYREIAETLKVPVDAAMLRLARGKDQLRAKLTPGVRPAWPEA